MRTTPASGLPRYGVSGFLWCSLPTSTTNASSAAKIEPGIEVVQRITGLGARLANADLVVTGEGSLDAQSLGGKSPLGVAAAARAASVPVVAVCGRTTLSADDLAAGRPTAPARRAEASTAPPPTAPAPAAPAAPAHAE